MRSGACKGPTPSADGCWVPLGFRIGSLAMLCKGMGISVPPAPAVAGVSWRPLASPDVNWRHANIFPCRPAKVISAVLANNRRTESVLQPVSRRANTEGVAGSALIIHVYLVRP